MCFRCYCLLVFTLFVIYFSFRDGTVFGVPLSASAQLATVLQHNLTISGTTVAAKTGLPVPTPVNAPLGWLEALSQ